ncbi:alginate lyase family protein [Gemmatimonas sp.]|uniref:alginate lyase family protein n=1 Tax=Gemmatimonas sp. TaxID=1962908 RepID=UPI003DA24575
MSVLLLAVGIGCGAGGDNSRGRTDGTPTQPPPPTPSFAISVVPLSAPLFRGTTGALAITVVRSGGFAGDVVVSLEGVPAGVLATDISIPAAQSAGSLRITIGDSAQLGTIAGSVRGRATGLIDQVASVSWTNADAPSFKLTFGNTATSLARGSAVTVPVTVTRIGGLTDAITLSADSLAPRLSMANVVISQGASAGTVTVTAQDSATLGASDIVIRGRSAAGIERREKVTVAVVDPTTFAISIDSSSLRVTQFGTTTIPVRVNRIGGFRGPIELSHLGGPIFANRPPVIVPADSTRASYAFTVSNGAAAGTYTVQVRGQSAGQPNRLAPLSLSIVPPFPQRPGEFLTCEQSIISNSIYCAYRIRRFEEFGLPALSSFVVRSRGFLGWDPATRREDLLQLPVATRQGMCSVTDQGSVPLETVQPPPPYAYTRSNNPAVEEQMRVINLGLVHNAGRWMAFGTPSSADYVIKTLEGLADSASLQGFNTAGNDGNSNYDATQVLNEAIESYYSIADAPQLTVARRLRIERYLGDLVAKLNYNQFDLSNTNIHGLDVNNHGWFRDQVLMKWGVLTGDNTLFQKAVARYVSVLAGQVRTDGSIFAEASRGNKALHYTANAIVSLVSIAEIAAGQGYDLYGMSINGMDIHKLVEFYVRAYEDEDVIRPYAQLQLGCNTPAQCAEWATQDRSTISRNGFNVAAWSEAYIRRFPTSANAARLVRMYPRTTFRALYVHIWGGNAACTFRR